MKKMLVLYGSGRKNGNTEILTGEMLKRIPAGKVSVEEVSLSNLENRFGGCCSCYGCQKGSAFACIQNDETAKLINRIPEFNIVVIASPVYFFHFTAQTMAFIDRFMALFHESDGKSPLSGIRFGYVITSGGDINNSGVKNAMGTADDIASFTGAGKNAFLYHGNCADIRKEIPALTAEIDRFIRELLGEIQ